MTEFFMGYFHGIVKRHGDGIYFRDGIQGGAHPVINWF